MIVAAFRDYLRTVADFPVALRLDDFQRDTAAMVHDSRDADDSYFADAGRPWYEDRLQVVVRAPDQLQAWRAGRLLYDAVRATRGTTLDGEGYRYRIEAVEAINGPDWFPTPAEGERVTMNFRLHVREEATA